MFGVVGKGRSCQCEGVSEESQGDPECHQEVTVRKEKPACCRGIVKGLYNVFVKLAWQIGVEWVAIASFHVVMQVLVVIQQLKQGFLTANTTILAFQYGRLPESSPSIEFC